MNAPGTALQGKDTAEASELYMAFELSDKKWKLALSDGGRAPSRYTVAPATRRRCWSASPRPRRAAGWRRRRGCAAVTRPAATASGCTAGCSSRGSTTSWWIRRALKSTAARGGPRPTGWTRTSCWRCCCATTRRTAGVVGGAGAHGAGGRRAAGAPGAGAAGARAHRAHQPDRRCWCCTTCGWRIGGRAGQRWWRAMRRCAGCARRDRARGRAAGAGQGADGRRSRLRNARRWPRRRTAGARS